MDVNNQGFNSLLPISAITKPLNSDDWDFNLQDTWECTWLKKPGICAKNGVTKSCGNQPFPLY